VCAIIEPVYCPLVLKDDDFSLKGDAKTDDVLSAFTSFVSPQELVNGTIPPAVTVSMLPSVTTSMATSNTAGTKRGSSYVDDFLLDAKRQRIEPVYNPGMLHT
jgi:hypothetical protein